MKIRKLHLKNYKVFDDLELDFTDENGETLNEIVIAGVNGSGKTTVLEFIRDTLTKKPNDNEDSYALYSFPDADMAYVFSHFMNDNKIYNKIYKRFKYFYNKKNENLVKVKIVQGEGTSENGSSKISPDSNYDISKINLLNKAVFRPSNDRITGESAEMILIVSFHEHKDEMKELIIKKIRKEVFSNLDVPSGKIVKAEIKSLNHVFSDLQLNSQFVYIDDDNLIFESINDKKIYYEDLSNGEKFIYFMGLMLQKYKINNSIIIIDEPEDSLHPTWQQQILKFYSNIGENNQVILATHSPHIIGSAKPESVFLLKPENGKINVYHPRYAKGHSANYVLSEIMETNPRENRIGKMVDEYLRLIEKGMHETERGKELWQELEKLDTNSNERGRIRLALRRLEVIGK